MNYIVTLVGFGIVTGATMMVPALGMTLMYGSSRVLNFAYGDFMTLAAFITLSLSSVLPLAVAVLLGVLALAFFGALTQRVVFAPLSRQHPLVLLITSLGLSFIISNSIRAIWGTDLQSLSVPTTLNTNMTLGPLRITPLQLIILVIAIIASSVAAFVLYRTDLGIKIRAAAENPALTQASGVAVPRLQTVTWAFASALAGLGGILIALTVTFNAGFGFSLLLVVAAAAIVGGLGSPMGALIGALVIGILTEVSTAWLDASLKYGVAFAALGAMMIIRPNGILGRAEE